MSVLTSIESGINCLYSRQSELDNLMSKLGLSSEEQYRVDMLKNEISDILADILALQCEDALSSAFYLQVNEIEQEIYSILDEKRSKLTKLSTYKNDIHNIANNILSLIYSIDVLEKSFHINTDSETFFLDIKNFVKTKELCDKKIVALEFLKEKLEPYKKGIKDIIMIANKTNLKEDLSFEKKQEIFAIFSSISLKTQRIKNHTKVYNEDIEWEEDTYTLEYLKWFEDLYLEMCKYVNLNLESFYKEIEDILCNNVITSDSLDNMIEYIFNRYQGEIEFYLEKVKKMKEKSNNNIKRQLNSCLTYEGSTDFSIILDKIKNEKILPKYIIQSDYFEDFQNLFFGIDISYNENIRIYNILDELQDAIFSLFDEDKYYEFYKYNSSIKSIQIANFRQYYISLLERSKAVIKDKYIEKIEKCVSKQELKSYTTTVLLQKIEEIKKDISLLEESLGYINKNYRDFSQTNLRLYIDSIQKRYQINNLYNNVLIRKSNFMYKVMAKSKLTEEQKYIYDFISREEIKKKLQDELVSKIFKNSEKLKLEVIDNLM